MPVNPESSDDETTSSIAFITFIIIALTQTTDNDQHLLLTLDTQTQRKIDLDTEAHNKQ
jgi:hypothetical protein